MGKKFFPLTSRGESGRITRVLWGTVFRFCTPYARNIVGYRGTSRDSGQSRLVPAISGGHAGRRGIRGSPWDFPEPAFSRERRKRAQFPVGVIIARSTGKVKKKLRGIPGAFRDFPRFSAVFRDFSLDRTGRGVYNHSEGGNGHSPGFHGIPEYPANPGLFPPARVIIAGFAGKSRHFFAEEEKRPPGAWPEGRGTLRILRGSAGNGPYGAGNGRSGAFPRSPAFPSPEGGEEGLRGRKRPIPPRRRRRGGIWRSSPVRQGRR